MVWNVKKHRAIFQPLRIGLALLTKAIFLLTVLSLINSRDGYAGEIFDEIIDAIRRKATDAELTELKDKHKGKVVKGQGYLTEIIRQGYVRVELILSDTNSEDALTEVINIIVPRHEYQLEKAKRLRKGQKIRFRGRLSDVIFGVIYIRGQVEFSTE